MFFVLGPSDIIQVQSSISTSANPHTSWNSNAKSVNKNMTTSQESRGPRHASMPKLLNHVPKDMSSGASGARQLQKVQEINFCNAALESAIPAPVVM